MRRRLKTEATKPRTTKQDTANLTAFLADGHMQAGEGGLWVVHCDDMIAPVLEQQQIPASSPCERPRLDLAGGGGDESSAALCRKSRIPVASWGVLYVLCRWCTSLPAWLLCRIPRHHVLPSLSAAPAANERGKAAPANAKAAAAERSHRRRGPAAIAQGLSSASYA